MSIETRLVTADEFEEIIAKPENQDRHLELFQGEIFEDMPTEEHGLIVMKLSHLLYGFVTSKRLGRVVVEVRRRPTDDNHSTLIADVDFTSNERLEARGMSIVSEGPVLQMPDLAVEVQSPGQSAKLMAYKADYYLENSVRMVWLIYPSKRIVEVLTNDARDLLSVEDTLSGGDVLPGFSVPIADIFEV